MKSTKYPGVFYSEGKNNNKTYYIRYSQGGKQVRQRVGSIKEGITAKYAENILNETKVKLRLGEAAPVKRPKQIISLDHAAKDYFKNLKAKSKSKLENIYETHLKNDLGTQDIQDLTIDRIDALKEQKNSTISAKTGRVLSPKTVNNILSLLVAILNSNKGITIPLRIKKNNVANNSRDKFLSQTEISTLYQTLEASTHPRAKTLLLFTKLSLFTGGRLGSILGIQGKHLNRDDECILLHNFKSGGTYTVYPTIEIMGMIPNIEPGEYLFRSDGDRYKQLHEKLLQKPLQEILNDLFNVGLDVGDAKHRTVIHTLRHTFASHLAKNGVPLQEIMELMDHSDIKMTQRYAKLAPGSGRKHVKGMYS